MHRAQGATGNCAIAFFLPALFYLGWAERFPRSLGPFVKGQSEAGWLRQCAKFIFLLGLFNSGSGIWGGTSILLAGHAPPPPGGDSGAGAKALLSLVICTLFVSAHEHLIRARDHFGDRGEP